MPCGFSLYSCKEKADTSEESEAWKELILENEEGIPLGKKDNTIQHVEEFCYAR